MKKTIVLTLGITLLMVAGCARATELTPTEQPTVPEVHSTEVPEPTPTKITSTDTPEPTAIDEPRINYTVSGIITEDEIWRDEIHITGDIGFSNGANLTIEPGTIVYIASNSDDRHANDTDGCFDEVTCKYDDPTMRVGWGANAVLIDGRGGVINAVGTPGEPIVFRPEGDSTSTSQYDGIYIERGALEYSRILYGSGMQVLGQPGVVEVAYNEIRHFLVVGIGVFKEGAWIHHNILEGGGHQAIGTATNNVLIEHNTILRCNVGINVENAGDQIPRDIIVRNNLILDCGNGIGIFAIDSEISNNTIAHIEGPPDGIYYQGELVYPVIDNWVGGKGMMVNGELSVLNNIIFGDFTNGMIVFPDLGKNTIIDYNLFWGHDVTINDPTLDVVGTNNTVADPLFIDLENWDLHLSPESPAIDAGWPNITDPDGSPSDIGAYGGPQANGWQTIGSSNTA